VATFWFLVGLMTGAVGALVVVPLFRGVTAFRGGQSPARPWRRMYAGGCVVALGAAAVLIYFQTGRSQLIGPAALLPAPHAVGSPAGTLQPAESIESAATHLAGKLAKRGGSDADWSLLAQSYDFLGRPEDAALARDHRLPAEAPLLTPQMARLLTQPPPLTEPTTPQLAEPAQVDPAQLEAAAKRNPRDVRAWLALAEARRRTRDFPAARTAYARAIALGGLSADAWADYADVLASVSGGKLAGQPADAIRKALALDPRHAKALWLDASLALEQRRYADAVNNWRALKAVLPPQSPDVRIVDANIREAAQLAHPGAAPVSADLVPVVSQAGAAQVAGIVQLDPQLLSKVSAGMTLFIFAKPVGGAGPPLAVMRTAVGQWPVRFTLDDSMAMLPERRLSAFDKVIVEARISRSGNAIAQAGDWVAVSEAVRPATHPSVALTIAKEIG
jgi:cytochrome c-type biogenesis protein CcmH/NrfG